MVSLPFVMMLALYHVNSYIATPAFVSFQSHHFETELRPNFFLHFSFCRVIVFSLPKPGKACKSVFAACIGVTKKAVESWEGGRSHPDGAARRTLSLMSRNPHLAEANGILE